MDRKVSWFLVFVLVTASVGSVVLSRAAWFSQPKPAATVIGGKPGIVATFYPLAAFARAIAGDAATVTTVIPQGMEPHDYEPTPQDILAAERADLFLANGAGLDEWAWKIRPDIEAHGGSVIIMGDSLPLLTQADEGTGSPAQDPHFWLDPVLAKGEAAMIRDALVRRDPTSAGTYAANADALMAKFDALDRSFRTGLGSCAMHDIITSHDAFNYLANRYGFTAHAIAGISPEEEPSPRRIAELSDLAKSLGTRYIFTESLVSPKIARTLAAEAGAETLVFDPLEGLTASEAAAGADYFSIMRDNLANLETALGCKPGM